MKSLKKDYFGMKKKEKFRKGGIKKSINIYLYYKLPTIVEQKLDIYYKLIDKRDEIIYKRYFPSKNNPH